MTDTKTTSKEISKTASTPAETSAPASSGKASAATDNIYLAFLQKAFSSFGIPVNALKKVSASNDDVLAKSLLIAALSGLTWDMLQPADEKNADIDLGKFADHLKGGLRDRFRENDSLADEIKEAMKANEQVSAGWQAAFDEMKKLYDGGLAEMKEEVKNVRAEMDALKKNAAPTAEIEPAVQSAASAQASGFHLFARKPVPTPGPDLSADAVEYQQNYLIFLKKFLENDDYSKEQKKFLLECWNAGDSVAKILFFHDKIKMAEAYAVKCAYTPSGINDFFDRVHCLSFETCI